MKSAQMTAGRNAAETAVVKDMQTHSTPAVHTSQWEVNSRVTTLKKNCIGVQGLKLVHLTV